MDCPDARLLLTLQRREPEPLDTVEVEALEVHVELCLGCQIWNRSEARFDAAMSAAMKNVAVPAGLRGAILSRLTPARSLARRVAWSVAAAVLLFGVVGGYCVWRGSFADADEYESPADRPERELVVEPQAFQSRCGRVLL